MTAEIHLAIAMSVDGFIADTKGSVDWLQPFQASGVDYGLDDFMSGIGSVVMGRKTYEVEQSFGLGWPHGDRPGFILTSRPLPDVPANATAVSDVPALVRSLRARTDGNAWLVGGGGALRAFLDEDGVDEMLIWIMPALLGRGVPLFVPGDAAPSLELRSSERYDDGVVAVRYRVQQHGL